MAPVSTPAEREIRREARRILRLLAKPGRLLASNDQSNGEFYLKTGNKGGKPAAIRIASRYVDAFSSRDWICRAGIGKWKLSDAGAAWLRRALAGDEPYSAQHRTIGARAIEQDDGSLTRFAVNQGESPLGWLSKRRDKDGRPLISEEQFDAGERLRRDFTYGHFTPNLTASWESPMSSSRRRSGIPGGGVDVSDAALAARQRFGKAIEAVGPELSNVLIDVCCYLKGMEEAEKAQGWPRRSGKIVLQMALTRLARHYGLLKNQKAHPAPITQWGAKDYRPRIDG